MINIIILSLIMVQITHFTIIKTSEININNSEVIKFLYVTIPLLISMLYMKHSFTEEFLRYSILICFLIVISIIDYYTMYIYDITIISGIIIQGGIFLISPDAKTYITALLIGIIIPYILAKITKGLGEGDIGLYGLCCFVLGKNYSIYVEC